MTTGKSNAGRWFGASDANTRLHFLGFRLEGNTTLQQEVWPSVRDRVLELSRATVDGWPVVQLHFLREDERVCVVAFRFTSDRAHQQHCLSLFEAGAGSLARGAWEPFHDEWTFREWVA